MLDDHRSSSDEELSDDCGTLGNGCVKPLFPSAIKGFTPPQIDHAPGVGEHRPNFRRAVRFPVQRPIRRETKIDTFFTRRKQPSMGRKETE